MASGTGGSDTAALDAGALPAAVPAASLATGEEGSEACLTGWTDARTAALDAMSCEGAALRLGRGAGEGLGFLPDDWQGLLSSKPAKNFHVKPLG